MNRVRWIGGSPPILIIRSACWAGVHAPYQLLVAFTDSATTWALTGVSGRVLTGPKSGGTNQPFPDSIRVTIHWAWNRGTPLFSHTLVKICENRKDRQLYTRNLVAQTRARSRRRHQGEGLAEPAETGGEQGALPPNFPCRESQNGGGLL